MEILEMIVPIRKNKKKGSWMVWPLLFITVSAMPVWAVGNDGRVGVSSAQERQAQAALEELRRAYTERDLSGFFENVSEDAYFNSLELKSDLSRAFSNISQSSLNIFVDQVLTENDKVLLKTHWQKRAVDRATGQSRMTEGRAQFIFRVMADKAQLISIKDASPF